MRRIKVGLLIMSVFLMMAVPATAADHDDHFEGHEHEHEHFGRVVPAFGGLGWYSPYFFGPGLGWYGAYGPNSYYYRHQADTGHLKLKVNVKDAKVYINGAYAGKAKDLKSLWLRPESYEIQVRAPGYETYATRIYLLRGKTMEVKADLVPVSQAQPQPLPKP